MNIPHAPTALAHVLAAAFTVLLNPAKVESISVIPAVFSCAAYVTRPAFVTYVG